LVQSFSNKKRDGLRNVYKLIPSECLLELATAAATAAAVDEDEEDNEEAEDDGAE